MLCAFFLNQKRRRRRKEKEKTTATESGRERKTERNMCIKDICTACGCTCRTHSLTLCLPFTLYMEYDISVKKAASVCDSMYCIFHIAVTCNALQYIRCGL